MVTIRAPSLTTQLLEVIRASGPEEHTLTVAHPHRHSPYPAGLIQPVPVQEAYTSTAVLMTAAGRESRKDCPPLLSLGQMLQPNITYLDMLNVVSFSDYGGHAMLTS